VSRAVPGLAAACAAALLGVLVPAAGGGTRHARAATADTVLLRGRLPGRAWTTSLYLKLVKTNLRSFFLCAIWNHQPGTSYDCAGASDNPLPPGYTLRMEQTPVGPARKQKDSPAWGLIGMSTDGSVGTPVSNTLAGNHTGVVRYRTTLRDSSGQVLATSNLFVANWHG